MCGQPLFAQLRPPSLAGSDRRAALLAIRGPAPRDDANKGCPHTTAVTSGGDFGKELCYRILEFRYRRKWQWEPGESTASGSGSDMSEGNAVDHAKTLLRRATTVSVRVGSEVPDPMPELSVTLTGAHGQAWAAQVETVHAPRIVGVPGDSETGLWEIEYVFELPADWVETGHRASLAIDPYNRLEETDEDDNVATLNMEGHAVPVFDVTFVPVVLSGDPPGVDTDIYMAVIGDLLPIGDYTARVGRVLDLSDRNLGASNTQVAKFDALEELR